MSADVELKNISVTFGSFYAAKNVSVKIDKGEFFSFLGPSGCGKTTLITGNIWFFEVLQKVRVLIGGQDMSGIGPNKRPTSLNFSKFSIISFNVRIRKHSFFS